MPLYAYQVLDRVGRPSKGKLEAENELEAATKLKRIGYTTLELQEVKHSAFATTFELKRKVGIGELSLFSWLPCCARASR